MKYSIGVFVFWHQQWTDSLPHLLVGGDSETFSFPLSFSLFRPTYIILQFPLCYRIFGNNSRIKLSYLVLLSLCYYFSCFSLICLRIRIRICKLPFLFFFFPVGKGRMHERTCLFSVLLEILSCYPIFLFNFF